MAHLFFFLGAVLAGLAVAIGAYSAHTSTFDEVQLLWLEKGARYQIYHAFGLILAGLALANRRKFKALTVAAGCCFIGGIVCFSGSLYAMTFIPFEAGYHSSWPVALSDWLGAIGVGWPRRKVR